MHLFLNNECTRSGKLTRNSPGDRKERIAREFHTLTTPRKSAIYSQGTKSLYKGNQFVEMGRIQADMHQLLRDFGCHFRARRRLLIHKKSCYHHLGYLIY